MNIVADMPTKNLEKGHGVCYVCDKIGAVSYPVNGTALYNEF